MEDIISNISNGSLNSNFKEQFDNISSNFEEFAKKILADFFAFVDRYILDLKVKAGYTTSPTDQEEVVRRTCFDAFSLLRESTIDNLLTLWALMGEFLPT